MRPAAIVLRALGAIALIAAVVGQLVHSIGYWTANDVQHLGISIWNFFSFFTILSNVGAVVALGVGAVLLARRPGAEPAGWTVFRACVATYMVITGIVYNTMLRGIELPQGATLEWSNELLHLVGPIVVLVDWLIAPGRTVLPWSRIWTIIAFPIVWIAYTLVRGPLIPNEMTGAPYWYPYPFLDPNLPGASYWTVAGWSGIIAVAFVLVGLGVILVSRRMHGTAASAHPGR